MKLADAFAQCRTPADFYRVQIMLENERTPLELLEQFECRDELAPPARKWISALEDMMRRGSEHIQPFMRTSLSENVQFYHVGTGNGAKSLLIGFCGNFQRLMMPLPIFLQHVPADIFDVVILKDPGRDFFFGACPAMSPAWHSCLKGSNVTCLWPGTHPSAALERAPEALPPSSPGRSSGRSGLCPSAAGTLPGPRKVWRARD